MFKNAIYQIWCRDFENLARILQTVATGAERWSRPGELSQTARARWPSHQLPPPPPLLLPPCHPPQSQTYRLRVLLAIIIIHNLWHPSLSPTPDQCLISSTWKQANNIKGPQNSLMVAELLAIFSWFCLETATRVEHCIIGLTGNAYGQSTNLSPSLRECKLCAQSITKFS